MQGDEEKNEKPTPHRLKESRDRGEVAKSSEFTGWLVMAAFAVALIVTAASVGNAVLTATAATLQLSGARPAVSAELAELLAALVTPVGKALLPALMAVVLLAVIGNLAQAGAVFSAHPLTPNWQRMNPSQALSRIFSMQTVFEFMKLAAKGGVLAAVAWWGFSHLDAFVTAVAYTDPTQVSSTLLGVFRGTSIWILLPLGALAVVDLIFVRFQHTKKLRMSRREIKDEHKQQEGDPEIRSKRKRLVRDLLKRNKSSSGAARADVVITNPTHIAVALRYRPREMRAPIVVAKGAGRFAARIRRDCGQAGIPTLRRPELARRLFREYEVEQPISAGIYRELAPIYRWLMSRPEQEILS